MTGTCQSVGSSRTIEYQWVTTKKGKLRVSKIKTAADQPEVSEGGNPLPEFDKNVPANWEGGLAIVRNKGVPPRARLAGVSKYNIARLGVGDAFTSNNPADIRNAAVAARAYAKREKATNGQNLKYVTRKEPNGLSSLIREN